MTRTAVVWVEGERYVFRDGEVDELLELGSDAATVAEAWDRLRDYGRSLGGPTND